MGKRGLQHCVEEQEHKEPFQQQFDLWMQIRGLCFKLFVNQVSTAELCWQGSVGMSQIGAR